MRILVIEDNKEVAKSLARGLDFYYKIKKVYCGEDGVYEAEVMGYDLIILDLGLPDMEGLEVCRAIRNNRVKTPLLILTVNDDTATKIALFNAGADDYITKPFSLEELKARIRALLRRENRTALANMLDIGDLHLGVVSREVKFKGKDLILRRKEFDILEYLMRNVGTALSRDAIFNHVWDSESDTWINSVDVHIKYLRDKIDRPFNKKLIKTVHGIGYKIA